MLEDFEGISDSIKASDYTKDSLSAAEVDYVNECVLDENPADLVDRIDELSSVHPPKGIDNTAELAEIIEPMKDRIDSKYLEAPADIEQIEQISDYLSSLEILEYDKWIELSQSQRLETLQEAENNIAEIEHRNPCEVKLEQMEYNHFGYFNPEDKTITLNALHLNDNSLLAYKDTLDTLVHEGRHAYQDYNMTERVVHPRGGEVNIWKWNENELGYQTALFCGFEAYAMQPLETDARAFAEDVLTTYFNKTA